MPVKYVFWDSDNTLVDTYEHHWKKHVETLATHGITLDARWKDRVYSCNGSQNWEWMRLELGLKLDEADYLNEIDSWYYRRISDIKIREGVLDVLALFKEMSIPMAVVSNGRRRSVMAALEAKDLARYFKFIWCKEDYPGRKPDASPYLTAKTRMQQIVGTAIESAECLAIEDDPLGVQAATAAGMHVIHRPVGQISGEDFFRKCQSYCATPPL
jgi:HAD superfamily hydrolase (TIGR01509 family)